MITISTLNIISFFVSQIFALYGIISVMETLDKGVEDRGQKEGRNEGRGTGCRWRTGARKPDEIQEKNNGRKNQGKKR
jgi:hypothetical protein